MESSCSRRARIAAREGTRSRYVAVNLFCAWAQAYYQKKRAEGHPHAEALRCLGQRWLKILWKMWQDHTSYDEARHALDQTRHGSWVIGLLPDHTTAGEASMSWLARTSIIVQLRGARAARA